VTAEERAEFVALRHVPETYAAGCRRQADLASHTADKVFNDGRRLAYQHAADVLGKVLAKTDRMAATA
jgi:hypothetical protein